MDLHKAAGKYKFDSDIIDQDFNPSTINEVDANGNTILHRVMSHPKCSSDVIILLVMFGAKVNELNKEGNSALTLATQNGCSFEVIRTLLKSSAKVNQLGSDGRSPLCNVLHLPNCDSDIIQVFLSSGASARACTVHPNLFHCYMNSPIEVQADVLKLVLLMVLGMRSFPTQALCLVLSYPTCSEAVVKMLLEMGCRFNACLMHESSFHCYLDESVYNPNGTKHLKVDVLELLGENATTFHRSFGGGQSPLCLIMRHSKCSVDAVRILLRAGSSVTHCKQHTSPLHCYLDKPDTIEKIHLNADVLKVLLKSGLDVNLPNHHGRTPLHMALHYFNCTSEILKILLDASATLNDCYAHISLLYCYVGSNNVEIDGIEMILKKCTNINVVNRYGDMPLHCALKFAKYEVGAIKLLLEHPDIDVQAKGRNRSSFLHCALQNPYCKIEVVKLLLKKGIRVNVMDNKGYTPLHTAVSNPECGLDLIELLINNGSSLRYDNLITPLEIALRRNRNPDLVRLLLSAGAPIAFGMKQSMLEMAFNVFDRLQCENSKQCFMLVLKYAFLAVGGAAPVDKAKIRALLLREWFPRLRLDLCLFAHGSVREVKIMSTEYIAPDFTLYDLVSSGRGMEVPKFNIDRLLGILVDENLSLYYDLISMKIDSNELRGKLRKVLVHTVIPDLQGGGDRKLVLNGDVSCHLSHFLPAKDLLSCVVAYYKAAYFTDNSK